MVAAVKEVMDGIALRPSRKMWHWKKDLHCIFKFKEGKSHLRNNHLQVFSEDEEKTLANYLIKYIIQTLLQLEYNSVSATCIWICCRKWKLN